MKRALILLIIFVLASGSAAPQERSTDKAAQFEAVRAASLADPTSTSKALEEDPNLILETTEEGAFLVGSIGYRGKQLPWSVNLKLRAPLEKDTEISLADLDGPIGKTQGTLALSYSWERDLGSTRDRLEPICRDHNSRLLSELETRQGTQEPIPMEAGGCTFDALRSRGGKLALQATEVRNIQVPDALCAEYNEGRGTDRLLPAGIGDLQDEDENQILPRGYSGLCNLENVKPRWIKARAEELKNAARKAFYEAHNKKVSSTPGLRTIPAEECTDQKLTSPGYAWELDARRIACLKAAKDAACTWQDLASAAFTSRSNEIEKEKLESFCTAFNHFDSDAIVDSRVSECSYRHLASLGPQWEVRALRTMPVQLWTVTLSTSLAEPDFEFLDPEALEIKEVSRRNRDLSAQLGTFQHGTWWSLGYTRRATYRPGEAREFCAPADDTGSLLCRETRLGEPARNEQDLAQFDVKRQISPRLGLLGRLLYDFEGDLWNPHIFLFFLRKKVTENGQEKFGALQGGLDLAYNEDQGVTARLFVGTKFDMSKP